MGRGNTKRREVILAATTNIQQYARICDFTCFKDTGERAVIRDTERGIMEPTNAFVGIDLAERHQQISVYQAANLYVCLTMLWTRIEK